MGLPAVRHAARHGGAREEAGAQAVTLTPAQAAGLLAVTRAAMAGEVLDALQLPTDLGPVLVDLRRIAGQATPTVNADGALDAVATGLAHDKLPPAEAWHHRRWQKRNRVARGE